jgi:hypothetical protein
LYANEIVEFERGILLLKKKQKVKLKRVNVSILREERNVHKEKKEENVLNS